MSGTVAMHVQCATCNRATAVPYPMLPKLLQQPTWRCPLCGSMNQCTLDPKVADQLMMQYRLAQQHGEVDALPDLPDFDSPTMTSGSLYPAGSSAQMQRPGPVQQPYVASDNERDQPSRKRKQPDPWQTSQSANWNSSSHSQSAGWNGNSHSQAAGWNGNSRSQVTGWHGASHSQDPYGAYAQPPELEEEEDDEDEEAGDTFMEYTPSKLRIGRPHPDPVVETSSLAAVQPPDVTYQVHLDELVQGGGLSGLQLESITYACQRHEQLLPDGSRAGFFIGDGAGVGKGRTIAGLVLENWRCHRRRHVWLSVGADLRIDSRRDLDDVGAPDVEVYPLNKMPYQDLDTAKGGAQDGVLFSTYSSLISSSDKGLTRLQQVVDWCGNAEGATPDTFDGLILFDECHKAKNLVPDGGGKPTKVGLKVLELQRRLPQARVVYCSATGASEARNLGYMERLGLWGKGNSAFADFSAFLDAVQNRGMGALELVAMDMKARGMYVCRTLSFKGAEFDTVMCELEEPVRTQYEQAAEMWNNLRREFLYAQELADAANMAAGVDKKRNTMLWRAYWAAHQRFFRSMCMAAKIPALVRMTQQALEEGKCVVVGLQSTGEARTADVVAEKGEDLDDFVSGPRELLLRLADEHYPVPSNARPTPSPFNTPGNSDEEEDAASDSEAFANLSTATTSGRRRKLSAKAAAAAGILAPGPSRGRGRGRARGRGRGRGRKAAAAAADNGDSDLEILEESSSARPLLQYTMSQPQTPQQVQLNEKYVAQVKRRDQVKEVINSLALPNNPLDTLIDLLGGPDNVAEMTGRKGRLVRNRNGTGVRWEARNASGMAAGGNLEMINVTERKLFMDKRKRIAVISEAASAGISLHADRRAVNQQRRMHLTLELPWSADRAIQQFGRSHRANQTHAPQYRLLFTPLGGERRFAAAVARRLQNLGALTQGDRRAGPSLQAFNFESPLGRQALKTMYQCIQEEAVCPFEPPACRWDLVTGEPPALESRAIFFGQARAHLLNVGLMAPAKDVSAVQINHMLGDVAGAHAGAGKVSEPDRTDIPRFLNRLLGLAPIAQKYIFDFFMAMLTYVIDDAKKTGKYDEGIVDVKGTSVTLMGEPRAIRHDEHTGAPTLLYCIRVDRGISWEQALARLEDAQAGRRHAATPAGQPKAGAAPAAAAQQPPSTKQEPGAQDGAVKQEPSLAAVKIEGADPFDEFELIPELEAPAAQAGPVKQETVKQEQEPAHREQEAAAVKPDPELAPGRKARAPKEGGPPASKHSGFYQTVHAGMQGKRHVLLALEIPGKPDHFTVLRPSTGPAVKPMKLDELNSRYEKLSEGNAEDLWGTAYTAAGDTFDLGASFRPGQRFREVLLIGGLVLPVWNVVRTALSRMEKAAERRMQVLRIQTTGATAQRLVGMLLPQAASGQVLREIEADERRRLQAQADAELAALSATNLQEEGWTWGNPTADATGSHTFSGLPPVQSGAGAASQEFYESSTYSGQGTLLSPQQPGQYAAPLAGQPAPGGHVAAQPTGQQWQQWQSAPIVSGNSPLHITLKQ